MAYINKINVGGTIYDIALTQDTIGEGMNIKNGKLGLNLGTGLQINNEGELMLVLGSGIIEDKNSNGKKGIRLNAGDGFDVGDGKLEFKLGSGLEIVEGKLTVKIGAGLEYDQTTGAIRTQSQPI